MRDFSLKLGESSDFITVTDEYNKALEPSYRAYCSIGNKSGEEVKRIELERISKYNPNTNNIEGYYLVFQITPELSCELGVGKYKYGIYLYKQGEKNKMEYFKEFEVGSISIKDTFVKQSKDLYKLKDKDG